MVWLKEYLGGVSDLGCYEQKHVHLVLDIKIGKKFFRKVRYCSDGHNNVSPYFLNCGTVVYQDYVGIFILTEAINFLSILGADVHNYSLKGYNQYKWYLVEGPELGPLEGIIFIITRALHGLKSYGD